MGIYCKIQNEVLNISTSWLVNLMVAIRNKPDFSM
jgi:hypothetical protein